MAISEATLPSASTSTADGVSLAPKAPPTAKTRATSKRAISRAAFMMDLLMSSFEDSSYVHNNMDHPLGPFLYTIFSTNHCMTVSLAQDGAGLGTMWGEEKAVKMLKEAGFGEVEVKQLPHDFFNSYYIAKKA